MRATIFVLAAMAGVAVCGVHDAADAQTPARQQAAPLTDASAQARRRPRVRIYRPADDRGVIPSYFPGSNAVRECSVRYVQEFRPSGTVIAPHMNCFWRRP